MNRASKFAFWIAFCISAALTSVVLHAAEDDPVPTPEEPAPEPARSCPIAVGTLAQGRMHYPVSFVLER